MCVSFLEKVINYLERIWGDVPPSLKKREPYSIHVLKTMIDKATIYAQDLSEHEMKWIGLRFKPLSL